MQAIDVCLATYKRLELLTELLHSLLAQNLDGLCMRIIVVDNDHEESARLVIENARSATAIEIVYDVEPCQSISMARNRALQLTNADYFAFVDDDEIVPVDWLTTLLGTMMRYDADVVFGPVVSLLPSDAPKWARVQPSFCRSQRTTGTILEHGATNNVLVRRSALGQPPQLFDLSFGLSGGGDTDFFFRMHLAGRRLIWCDEAVVREQVPASRLTLKWLRQRGFRSGQSFVRVFVRRYSFSKRVAWFVKRIFQLLGFLVALPFVRILSYARYVHTSVRIMAVLGQLNLLFSNVVYEEYRADRYK